MNKIRIIARLDVKPPYVIKGVHFEGWRKMGKPEDLALKYYEQGADEIFYIDCVASLFRREIFYEYIQKTSQNIFVPFCVGGGIKTVDDVAKLLHHGADKVVMNTYAIQNPNLIRESAKVFGNQCVVVSIEAKKWDGWWECYTDCGRIKTNKDAIEWAKEAQDLGAGEILLTAVDAEGRKKGFDIELMKNVSQAVSIPVVASGGAGNLEHIESVITQGQVDAVAVASVLHYDVLKIKEIKKHLESKNIEVSL
ncbi:MAG: imidazole glycerol phosphate synthase subunit HisF [Candidatus Omnitrophica bacterium]|nr:imidazole glycerol phosphate synthase subunit HisF [Candidatus Omnitrophota bacterium]